MKYLSTIILTLLLTFTVACSTDDSFTTTPSSDLVFSDDTVSFDTLFTTIGSATQNLRVFNNSSENVSIGNIRLASGGTSGFRVNVDGVIGTSFSDVDLRANDSLYIFIELTMPKNNSNELVDIKDSILFTMGNKVQKVLLTASGMDAIQLRSTVITDDETFTSATPYIIYDSLVVAEGAKLTLMPGTRLYFHSGAGLRIHGTIDSEGTIEQPVVMRGDRLDHLLSYLPYDRVNSQWDGIRIYASSFDNNISNTDIHSGNYGIQCDSSGVVDKSKLVLLNSVVHNVSGHALSTICNKVDVANTQLSNAGGDCAHIEGGACTFVHCTLAQFYPWSASRGSALTFMAAEGKNLVKCDFTNCIITGIAKDELFGTPSELPDVKFDYSFVNCLIHTPEVLEDAHFINNLWDNEFKDDKIGSATNGSSISGSSSSSSSSSKSSSDSDKKVYQDGNFVLVDHDNFIYDFHLDSMSLARGKAQLEAAKLYPTDRNGVSRATKPDIGCYQSNYKD